MRLIIKKGDMMAKTPNKKTQKVIKEARKNKNMTKTSLNNVSKFSIS